MNHTRLGRTWRTAGMFLISLAAVSQSGQTQAGREAEPPTVGTGVIVGRVLIANESQSPVRRARLTLESEATGQARLADSGTDGRYRFESLPPGSYRLRVEKPGFVTWGFAARHAYDPGQFIRVSTGATETADVGMPRGAALAGCVLTENGETIANLVVSACRVTYGPYGRQAAVVKEARTDDLGRYRLHSLPAGDYLVQAAPDPLVPGPPGMPSGRLPGIARTYYPGSADLAEARRVTVHTGEEAADLDFRTLAVPLAQITIAVLDSAGRRPPIVTARLQRVGSPAGEVRGARTADGAFFDSVPPGEFWATAVLSHGPGSEPEFALQRTTVSGRDVTVALRARPGARVRGRVLVAPGSTTRGVSYAGVRVWAESVGLEPPMLASSGGSAPAGAEVQQDGSFSLDGVFGPSLFRLTGLPSGWALASVRLDQSEVIDAPLDLSANQPPPDPVLTMGVTDATASISGVVLDSRRQRVSNARVVVFPEDERGWQPASRYIHSVLASVDGAFSMSDLMPGAYFLAATDWLDPAAWFDPDLLRRLRSGASRIALEAKAKGSVTLTLGTVR